MAAAGASAVLLTSGWAGRAAAGACPSRTSAFSTTRSCSSTSRLRSTPRRSEAARSPERPRRRYEVVGAVERAHVEAFLKLLGSEAVKRPLFDFQGTTEQQQPFLKTAVALEDLAVAAYKGQAPKLRSRAVLAAAVGIHSVEARHAAWMRELFGITAGGATPSTSRPRARASTRSSRPRTSSHGNHGRKRGRSRSTPVETHGSSHGGARRHGHDQPALGRPRRQPSPKSELGLRKRRRLARCAHPSAHDRAARAAPVERLSRAGRPCVRRPSHESARPRAARSRRASADHTRGNGERARGVARQARRRRRSMGEGTPADLAERTRRMGAPPGARRLPDGEHASRSRPAGTARDAVPRRKGESSALWSEWAPPPGRRRRASSSFAAS